MRMHFNSILKGNYKIRRIEPRRPVYNVDTQQYHVDMDGETYIFNNHGKHMHTVDRRTGKYALNFTYNVDLSYGRLTSLTDAGGRKLFFMHDNQNEVELPSDVVLIYTRTQVHIENAQLQKCTLTLSSQHKMLSSFSSMRGERTDFVYAPGELLTSRLHAVDQSATAFMYDTITGRLTQSVTSIGTTIELRHRMDGGGDVTDVLYDGHVVSTTSVTGGDQRARNAHRLDRHTIMSDASGAVYVRTGTVYMQQYDVIDVERDAQMSYKVTGLGSGRMVANTGNDCARRQVSVSEVRVLLEDTHVQMNGLNVLTVDYDNVSNTDTYRTGGGKRLLSVVYNTDSAFVHRPRQWCSTHVLQIRSRATIPIRSRVLHR
jgi:hypothetical protein